MPTAIQPYSNFNGRLDPPTNSAQKASELQSIGNGATFAEQVSPIERHLGINPPLRPKTIYEQYINHLQDKGERLAPVEEAVLINHNSNSLPDTPPARPRTILERSFNFNLPQAADKAVIAVWDFTAGLQTYEPDYNPWNFPGQPRWEVYELPPGDQLTDPDSPSWAPYNILYEVDSPEGRKQCFDVYVINLATHSTQKRSICKQLEEPDEEPPDEEPPDEEPPPNDEPPPGPPPNFDTCPPYTSDYYFDHHGYDFIPYASFLLIRREVKYTNIELWEQTSIRDPETDRSVRYFHSVGVTKGVSNEPANIPGEIDSNEFWVRFDPCAGDKIVCFREERGHFEANNHIVYGFIVVGANGDERIKVDTYSISVTDFDQISYLTPYDAGYEVAPGYTFNPETNTHRWVEVTTHWKLIAFQPHRLTCPYNVPPRPQPPDMSCCNETLELLRKILKRIGDDKFPIEVTSPVDEIDDLKAESLAEALQWEYEYNTWVDINRIGINDFPVKLPTTMIDDGDAQTELLTFPQLIVHDYQYKDEMLGKFPIDLQVKAEVDGSVITDRIELKNLSEAIAEIYAIAYQDVVTTSEMQQTQIRMASEMLSVKALLGKLFDVSFATMDALGFDFGKIQRKIKSAFNPGKDVELNDFLENGTIEIDGYEAKNKDDIWGLVMKMAKSVEIIKAVFYKTGDIDQVAPEIFEEFIGLRTKNKEAKKEDWEGFVDVIEEPPSTHKTSVRPREIVDLEND